MYFQKIIQVLLVYFISQIPPGKETNLGLSEQKKILLIRYWADHRIAGRTGRPVWGSTKNSDSRASHGKSPLNTVHYSLHRQVNSTGLWWGHENLTTLPLKTGQGIAAASRCPVTPASSHLLSLVSSSGWVNLIGGAQVTCLLCLICKEGWEPIWLFL